MTGLSGSVFADTVRDRRQAVDAAGCFDAVSGGAMSPKKRQQRQCALSDAARECKAATPDASTAVSHAALTGACSRRIKTLSQITLPVFECTLGPVRPAWRQTPAAVTAAAREDRMNDA
jgi:hypothetical protein